MPLQNSNLKSYQQFNPIEFILTDFGDHQDKEKNRISSKKVTLEILVIFLLFSLFTYSLKLIDQKYGHRQQIIQKIENHQLKIYGGGEIYNQFQKGYIGQNLIEIENYQLKNPMVLTQFRRK